ncbi:MAG: CbiX/SirB N-terminal domain-containing protein [Nitrospinota bacterium]|nr:CbiX/SirB N-terminal domain-containing protein [Nitrospinota bacterium]
MSSTSDSSTTQNPPEKAPRTSGIILLYHGSGQPQWMESAQAQKLAIDLAAPEALARIACLKDFQPTAAQAANELSAAGITRILVVPMFMAPGGHASKDFPMLANELSARWPSIEFTWTDVVGGWAEVAAAVASGTKNRLKKEG